MRRLGGFLLATALLLGVGVGAAAAQTVPTTTDSSGGGGGGGSSAIAVNKKDGSSVFKLAFSVRRVTGDTVDTSNAAVAYASCNECQTVAASIQVVLAFDDPSTVTPTNMALAINYQCNECDTLAAAYQVVFGDGQPVHFTPEGNRQLAQEKQDLHALKQQDGLTLQQIADQIAAIAARVADTVATQLVPAGPPGSADTTTTSSSSSTSTTAGGESTTTPSTMRPLSTTGSTAPTTTSTAP